MTVKIWDVTTQACQHTFTHHKDKVQSVVWHYDEAWLLASGAFDQSIALLDCRTGNIRSAHYCAVRCSMIIDIDNLTLFFCIVLFFMLCYVLSCFVLFFIICYLCMRSL